MAKSTMRLPAAGPIAARRLLEMSDADLQRLLDSRRPEEQRIDEAIAAWVRDVHAGRHSVQRPSLRPSACISRDEMAELVDGLPQHDCVLFFEVASDLNSAIAGLVSKGHGDGARWRVLLREFQKHLKANELATLRVRTEVGEHDQLAYIDGPSGRKPKYVGGYQPVFISPEVDDAIRRFHKEVTVIAEFEPKARLSSDVTSAVMGEHGKKGKRPPEDPSALKKIGDWLQKRGYKDKEIGEKAALREAAMTHFRVGKTMVTEAARAAGLTRPKRHAQKASDM